MLFDTHAHYDDERYKEDNLEDILSEDKSNGVELIVNCGSDMETSISSIELSKKYDFIYCSVGIHPHGVENLSESDIEILRSLSSNSKVVAIGEIGLDYYYENAPKDLQKHWFRRQLELALELNLPVIIHDRDAHKDIMDILKEYSKKGNLRGVVHCYTGSSEMAQELIKIGFYIAFGGTITFKNARKTVEAAEVVPIDRLLIETDSPYLSPEPFRGKRNSSQNVAYVAKKIAEIKGLSQDIIEEITMSNGKKLFGIE